MTENSNIEWTNHTWNPWQGCHKVSEGCRNCYMYRDKKRFGQVPGVVVRSSPATFNKPFKWTDPARVFTCSWSDFFIEEADPWRKEAWDIIRKTPHLTNLILTKRIERVVSDDMQRYDVKHLPKDWGEDNYGHVQLGATINSQEEAAKRIPRLIKVKGLNRWLKIFVSIEPMIEEVRIYPYLGWRCLCNWHKSPGCCLLCGNEATKSYALDWVVCGGESGPGARPMHPDWARKVRDDCKEAGVPFMFKQWGEWISKQELGRGPGKGERWGTFDIHGNWFESTTPWNGRQGMDSDTREVVMVHVGKKAAGRLLDGVEHMEVER